MDKYQHIIKWVTKEIRGRMPVVEDNIHYLLDYVVAAGRGDHLEIGTLFGGSAISVALAKREYNLDGMVYCIDPLNGYYFDRSQVTRDSGVLVCPETLEHNLKHFDVKDRVCYLREYSYPFPKMLENFKFVSAFIDGDHWEAMPAIDWMSVRPLIEPGGYVVFDNYDEKHPAVVDVCDTIKAKDYEFDFVGQEGITFTVRRKECLQQSVNP